MNVLGNFFFDLFFLFCAFILALRLFRGYAELRKRRKRFEEMKKKMKVFKDVRK